MVELDLTGTASTAEPVAIERPNADTRAPRVQYLAKEQVVVCCCQGYSKQRIPLVEAVVDSGAKESVASTWLQVTLAMASNSRCRRVTFKAPGGDIEDIKTERKMTLVRRGREESTSYDCGAQRAVRFFLGSGRE